MTHTVVHVTPGEALTVTIAGRPIDLRPKERVVAAVVTLHHPKVVTLNQLVDLVWPGTVPATAQRSLHNHLARIRRAAPGLIESAATGYVLGDGVAITVARRSEVIDDTQYLIEFADRPEVRRSRADFVRRHVGRVGPGAFDIARPGSSDEVIRSLEEAVLHEPGDERSWWLLAIATTRSSGHADGIGVIERARDAVAEVGLGPGRRLLDLEGMLRDGVADVEVLLRDPYGSSGNSADDLLGDAMSARLADVRETWTENDRFLVVVRGADDRSRRAVLARIVDDARASGFSTAFARHLPGDIGPPTIRTAHRGLRPTVMVADGFDRADDPANLARRVADRLSSQPVGWVVTAPPGSRVASSLQLAGLPDSTATCVVDLPTSELPTSGPPASDPPASDLPDTATSGSQHTESAAIARSTDGTRHLLRLLAVVGEPIIPDHLSTIAPGVSAAALDAARAGLARVDAATHTIDLVSDAMAAAALDDLDDDDRRSIAADLLELELPALTEARRCELRSRWSIDAHGAADPRTVEYTLDAAEAYSRLGEYDIAARVIIRTLRPIEVAAGRSARWCRLAIRAGRVMLAGGDPAGDDLLADVVAAASALGDDAIAARATLEWCRLGSAGGAGSADDARLRVTTELLERLTEPADRAQVGAAAAMVLSLAGDPDALRARFDDAVSDARASADPMVLADVLLMAYMATPLHSDIAARDAHADELSRFATEFDRPDSRWEALQIRYSNQVMSADPGFRDTFEELCAVASALHERSREWEMHYVRSNMAMIDGDTAGARREIDGSLEFTGQINEARVAAVFGAHHLVAAMVDGTSAFLLDALRGLADGQPGIGAWHAARAVAAAAAGEHDEAVRSLGQVVDGGEVLLVRDPVYSAGLVAIGEAAVATGDRASLDVAAAHLEPLAGTWSWCGSCTFGPIDLTRARVALALGDLGEAERLAADAVVTCAEMRAPIWARQATDLLLTIVDT